MSIDDFIISVFCLVDDELEKILGGKKLRQRGPEPGLKDSEVITIEIVGEFLGMDCDKTIWEYFKRHWSHFFSENARQIKFCETSCQPSCSETLITGEISNWLERFWRHTAYNRRPANPHL